ncbi:MAG: hypothetical protein HS111_23685 [Kofleriaceae bacterium]|nr:hypothetical protein [Kofleriaceae bacterium]
MSGKVTFTLYDTHGFPDDLTAIIAGERSASSSTRPATTPRWRQRARALALRLERAGGGRRLQAARRRAGPDPLPRPRRPPHQRAPAAIVALVVDGARVERVGEGARVELVLDQTPFYAESGGQIGDAGVLLARRCAPARRRHAEARRRSCSCTGARSSPAPSRWATP